MNNKKNTSRCKSGARKNGMFVYAIHAHDIMFPGRPDLFYYGLQVSNKKSGELVNLFGSQHQSAMLIEASDDKCARMVAECLALEISTASIKASPVKVSLR